MKVMTVLGTRPEIIRLSQVITRLDEGTDHCLVYTGQNYDPLLSSVFFSELNVRDPDYSLGVRSDSFATQVGSMFERFAKVVAAVRPDRLLILGDTNSGLTSVVARRLGVMVFHMEAGNRCYNDEVPEEINRRIIDHTSNVLMPYTHRSKENLVQEGISRERIYVTGNPIYEVMKFHENAIDRSDVIQALRLEAKGYLLATLHRSESVDNPDRLVQLWQALFTVSQGVGLPVIVTVHPRTGAHLKRLGLDGDGVHIRALPPFGFFDFSKLERQALCVLTDSGTVQEECCILGIPSVVLRTETERPETIECGSTVLAGVLPEAILAATRRAIAHPVRWIPPNEYLAPDVSVRVANIVLGHR